MPAIWFYFDFACPYAYLALHQLPDVLQGLSWQVRYCPIVQPSACKIANIAQAQHLAQHEQIALQPPAVYPFDASAWALMALAASPHGRPSRFVCSTLFNAIWQHGHNPNQADIQQHAWHEATALLPNPCNRHSPHAQQQLDNNQAAALQYTITHSPSFVLQPYASLTQPQVFCGVDALGKLQTTLRHHQEIS